MPLVPMSYIKRWYRTDSWLYRWFSYTRQNPLWHRPIPQGAAICPAFWQALFGLFVLRPFVALLLSARWAARAVHLTRAIQWSDGKLARFWAHQQPLGVPTMVASMFSIGGLLVVGLYGLFWYMAVESSVIPMMVGIHLWTTGIILVCEDSVPTKRAKRYVIVLIGLLLALVDASTPGPFLILRLIDHIVGAAFWLYQWGVDALAFNLALWPWYLGFFVIWGAAMVVAWYTPYSHDYLIDRQTDLRLRKRRAAIMAIMIEHVATKLSARCNIPGHQGIDHWRARAKSSRDAWALLREIVDSVAWLKVDLSRLGLSISGARMDQMAEIVWDEYLAEQDAAQKAARAGDEWWARLNARVKAYWAKTYMRYWLVSIGRAIRWCWRQGMALVCTLWTLAKSAKQGHCPYMIFSANDLPDDQAPNQGGAA